MLGANNPYIPNPPPIVTKHCKKKAGRIYLRRLRKRNGLWKIGTWNVLSLNREGAEESLMKNLSRYGLDVLALQEIRRVGTGELSLAGYTIFYSGHATLQRLGVGFAVKEEALPQVIDFQAINERICVLRLKGKWFNITLINAHAPTEEKPDEDKDEFYLSLEDQVDSSPRQDIKIILGDFNAQVGREEAFRPFIGLHSLHPVCNDNGVRLASFAASKNMVISSTKFPHRDVHKGTWKSPDGRTVNQIDHVLIDRRHASTVQDVRSWRGADIDSDHFLVLCRVAVRICSEVGGHAKSSGRKHLDVGKLEDSDTVKRYQVELRNRYEVLALDEADVDTEWEELRIATQGAARKTIGYKRRRRSKPWFDDDCSSAVELRSQARLKHLQKPDDLALLEAYKAVRRTTRNLLKAKKRQYILGLVEELEQESRAKNSGEFFRRLKSFRRGFQPNRQVLRSRNGELISDSVRILEEWKTYFNSLLNGPIPDDPLPPPEDLDDVQPDVPPVTLEEVKASVDRLKKRKACGADDIPSELWKCGGDVVCEALHRLITKVWDSERLPDQWKEALIVPVFKKGDRKACTNYRGISLICTAYKVLSDILRQRLTPLAEEILGDYQCGFRRNRSTIDQIFTLRQILEKSWEHNLEVHNVFLDFKKAYDCIHREGLYNILLEFGIPKKLVRMVQVCLEGSRSRVVIGSERSDAFAINSGLRQGDGLSPLLFNLVLEKVVRAIRNIPGGVDFGGSIKILGFADDLDDIGKSREELRRVCSPLLTTAKRVGLECNEDKTKYLVVSRTRHDDAPLEVDGYRFGNVTEFPYLGSSVTHDNNISFEVNARIQSGSRCLQALTPLFRSRALSRRSKLRIYNAVLLPVVTYGCETWSLTQIPQRRLVVFENKVLRRILGPKTDPDTGRLRIRSNAEIRELTNQPFITSVISSRRLQWAGHVARAPRTRAIRRVLENRPRSPRPVGKPRTRWVDQVSEDAERLGVPDWRLAAQTKADWRKTCDEAVGLMPRWLEPRPP